MNENVAELITKNMEAEADAIKKYLPLMTIFKERNDLEALNLIKGIVAEEMKHAIILTAMLKKEDPLIQIERSKAEQALEYLKANLSA